MKTAWLKVWIAVVFEVLWVIGMKYADEWWAWLGTFIAILASFYYLIDVSKTLPVGTVYAVFVGLGTAGTVVSEIVFFDEPLQPSKLILIAILLAGVIGLKFVTGEPKSNQS